MFEDFGANRDWLFALGKFQQIAVAALMTGFAQLGFNVPDSLRLARIYESWHPLPSDTALEADARAAGMLDDEEDYGLMH